MNMEQDRAKRSRRTAKEIRRLLELFDTSGLNAKQFCITNAISETVFYKWCGRYRAMEEKNEFIPLEVSTATPTEGALFAEVSGIRIYQAVSASFLKELLA